MKKLFFLPLIYISFSCSAVKEAPQFQQLFQGESDLSTNWIGNLQGYPVENGVIISKKGAGNIYTREEYQDYIFRFEFKLPPGGNNGIGPRAPHPDDQTAKTRDVAYSNFEIQILDNSSPKYAKLKDWQYHGSAYGIAAAKRGALKPVGQWNSQEIYFKGTHLKVTVNGQTILDIDTAKQKPADSYAQKLAKGRNRGRGHVAFAGHGPGVCFRNISIARLEDDYTLPSTADNVPPAGFTALFDGKTLNNWQGLLHEPYDKPHKRRQLSADKKMELQQAANKSMHQHWRVDNGALYFDGKEGGWSLTTIKKYQNFELHCSWKITKNGDSGLYLRGLPQVQIWDPTNEKVFKHGAAKGSGGLWNNEQLGKIPLVKADKDIGAWNHFYIRMLDESVTVWLNGQLVVNDAPLENTWEKNKAIPPLEQIELQCHGSPVWFKNIYIKELP